jgi:hypothetical protein
MKPTELKIQIRNGMFGKRETLGEAMNYVDQMASACDDPAVVYTALMVVLNTICHVLEDEPTGGYVMGKNTIARIEEEITKDVNSQQKWLLP